MKILTKLCIFSWVFPGSGHMYYGQIGKASAGFVFTYSVNYHFFYPYFHHMLDEVSFQMLIIVLIIYIFVCTYFTYDVYKIGSSK
jgi:ammonia channel protein AmtB